MTKTTPYPTTKNRVTVSSTLVDIVGNCLLVLLLMGIVGYGVAVVHELPKANIVVSPEQLTPLQQQKVAQFLGTQADVNLLQANLQTYVDKAKQLDWIDHVSIRRDWQQGLVVKITPRQPIARFGSQKFVDASGAVFTPADSQQLQQSNWMRIQGNPQDTVAMMQQIKQIGDWYLPLGLTIHEVIQTPRMTWFYRFDNGLHILVDRENSSEKLYRLSQLLQHQLRPQLDNIQKVDLRYKNGMAITWREPEQVKTMLQSITTGQTQ